MTELRDKLLQQLHMQGCQAATHGWNDGKAGKDLDIEWIEQYEEDIVDDLLDAVIQNLPEKADPEYFTLSRGWIDHEATAYNLALREITSILTASKSGGK